MSWKTIALALGAVCTWQQWRSCTRDEPIAPKAAECARPSHEHATQQVERAREHPDREDAPPLDNSGSPTLYGIRVPPWAMAMLPAPGEDLRAYRDRMIPVAQLALAPQRARVARSLDDFAARANLDAKQRADLEASAKETAQAIEDRLMNAVLTGELSPRSFKPMAGVAVARDVLDVVDKANRRFVGNLRDDQRTLLAQHPFDFGDYLVFATKWEDAISAL